MKVSSDEGKASSKRLPTGKELFLRSGNFVSQRRLILIGLVMGIGLIVIGLVNFGKNTNENQGGIVKKEFTQSEMATEAGSMKSKTILIDIEGAVVKPGVTEVPDYSRIKDVLIAAGGLDAKADRTYISKSINLAQRVGDGMKLYFPFVSDMFSADSGQVSTDITSGLIISINTATEAQLDGLPGIGPVTATKIINGRPYGQLSDLLERKIVTTSVYQKIKDLVSL